VRFNEKGQILYFTLVAQCVVENNHGMIEQLLQILYLALCVFEVCGGAQVNLWCLVHRLLDPLRHLREVLELKAQAGGEREKLAVAVRLLLEKGDRVLPTVREGKNIDQQQIQENGRGNDSRQSSPLLK